MKFSSLQAQEYYKEFLELKIDIEERIKNLNYMKSVGTITEEGIQFKQDKIDEKVERFKFVLNQLKVFHEVSMEDLILLSLGIEV